MEKIKIVTHNGSFHADDVFAVVTVILHLGEGVEYSIIRTREQSLIDEADYVVDVGRILDPPKKRFDHHQNGGVGKHENGIPMASFGLVWGEYGEAITGSKEVADEIKRKLVYSVDALDNGVEISRPIFEDVNPYTISDYLFSYWIDDSVSQEEVGVIFRKVVGLAKNLIEREIQKTKNIIRDSKAVLEIYEATDDKRVIILEKDMAWGRALAPKPEPLLVVHPSTNKETWSVETVRTGQRTFEGRMKFPVAWAGLEGKELSDITGVPDARFCHKGRFLIVAGSKEGAVSLAKHALEKTK